MSGFDQLEYTSLPKGLTTSITLTRKPGSAPINPSSKLKITLRQTSQSVYTGTAVCPAILVTDNGRTLTEGTDYTVKYTNNINASVKVNGDGTLAMDRNGAYQPANPSKQPTITVTAKGNYSGSASVNFTILPKALSEVYPDGMELKAGDGTKPAVVLWDGGAKLAAKDYILKNGGANSSTVYKPAALKAGETLNLTAVGKGNYMGTAAITVTGVAKKSLNPITVTPVRPSRASSTTAVPASPSLAEWKAKTNRRWTYRLSFPPRPRPRRKTAERDWWKERTITCSIPRTP